MLSLVILSLFCHYYVPLITGNTECYGGKKYPPITRLRFELASQNIISQLIGYLNAKTGVIRHRRVGTYRATWKSRSAGYKKGEMQGLNQFIRSQWWSWKGVLMKLLSIQRYLKFFALRCYVWTSNVLQSSCMYFEISLILWLKCFCK